MRESLKRACLGMFIGAIAIFAAGCGSSKAPESIELTSNAQLLAKEGDTYDVSANIVMEDGVDTSVAYTSSDEQVATVSEEGVVTAAGYGTTTITVTSTVDETVSASMDVAVYDYCSTYAGAKYIDAMGCNIDMTITLEGDGSFTYYRAPMLVAIDGGGQMPEITDQGTYTIDGTQIYFVSEGLGEYEAALSIKDDKVILSGSIPTGGPSTDMMLAQNN